MDYNGALHYVGYNIDDLVARVIYAEVAFLLLYRRLPTKQELENFKSELILAMYLTNR